MPSTTDPARDAEELPRAELTEEERELIAFRQRLLEGRGMLLVPESWCAAIGGIFEPWSIVTKGGVEYVVIPDPWVPGDDGYFVPPSPPMPFPWGWGTLP